MTKASSFILVFLLFTLNSIFAQSTEQIEYETEGYKINFPGKFERTTQTLASSLGELLMSIISYEPGSTAKDSNYVYMIMETKYPDSTIHSDNSEKLDDFFKNSVDGTIKSVNGRLIRETKGLTGKYPNRTLEIDYQNGLAVIKMFMVLRGSNMIIVQTITNTQNYPNLLTSSFFNSFRLK